MSEPFRPYEKLVEISVFGKKFQVPERNSLFEMFPVHQPGNDFRMGASAGIRIASIAG